MKISNEEEKKESDFVDMLGSFPMFMIILLGSQGNKYAYRLGKVMFKGFG